MTSILLPQKISLHTLKDVLLYPYLNALGTIEFTNHQTDRKSSCRVTSWGCYAKDHKPSNKKLKFHIRIKFDLSSHELIKERYLWRSNFSFSFHLLYFTYYNHHTANLTSFDTPKYNSYGEVVGCVMLVFYMLIANVMLLNLLIAIFGWVVLGAFKCPLLTIFQIQY